MKKIGNYLFPSSDTHFERWMLYGEYQAKQRNALFNYMEERRKVEYIADVGGHVGLWSRPMIQRANTKYIWAFEPNSSVRECYVMNMSRFDNYTIYPIALGDKLAVYSDTAAWCSLILSVIRAPIRSPHAFQSFDADSMLILRPKTPLIVSSPTFQILEGSFSP